jgi:serine/threonine protein kinase/tetratricopeptide (TPR) repeat protein
MTHLFGIDDSYASDTWPCDSPLAPELRAMVDRIAGEFEAAWRQGDRRLIESMLPADEASQAAILLELSATELELRMMGGEQARVEDYVARFPQLGDRPKCLAWLANYEWRLRRRAEPWIDATSYYARFPAIANELRSLAGDVASCVETPNGDRTSPCPDRREAKNDERPRIAGGQVSLANADAGDFPTQSGREIGAALGVIGRFELLNQIGRGSFSRVFRARDPRLDRIVAVKIPSGDSLLTDEQRDRFLREAKNTAHLNHPGIVPIYELGFTPAGGPFIVSEFVPGETLASRAARGRFEPRDVAEVARQIANALQHAHGQGVIHRDLKPANVLLQDRAAGESETRVERRNPPPGIREGRAHERPSNDAAGEAVGPLHVRVTDFGLARSMLDATVTAEGDVLGTLAYMSPEQARGAARGLDGRSDVFSLGVVLYELLTGERPFRGSHEVLLQQLALDEPLRPSVLDRKVPRDLETICLKCLEKEPADRYESAEVVSAELARYLQGRPLAARPIAPLARTWRWIRRRPAMASAIALGAGLFVTLVAGSAALYRAKTLADASRTLAEQNEATTRSSLNVLKRILKSSDPILGTTVGWRIDSDGADVAIGEILKRAAPSLVADAERSDPRVGVEILCTVADVQRSLGMYDEASDMLVHARGLASQSSDSRALRSLAEFQWGSLCHDLGRFAEAESSYSAARRLRIDEYGAESLPVAEVEFALAWLYADVSRAEDSIALFRKVLDVRRKLLQDDRHVEVQRAAMALQIVLFNENRKDEAMLVALTIGGDENHVLAAIEKLQRAHDLRHERRYAEALPLYLDVLQTAESLFNAEHPYLIFLRIDVAGLYKEMGDQANAERHMRLALADAGSTLSKNRRFAHPLFEMAGELVKIGERSEARELYLRARELNQGRDADLAARIERGLAETE